MQKANSSFKEIWDVLTHAKNPICCIDSRLDFDAICSALAIYKELKKHEVDLRLTWYSKIAAYIKNMVDTGPIEEKVDPKNVDFSKHDVILILDSGTLPHVSPRMDFEMPENITSVDIDHHSTNRLYGDYNYVDSSASSACLVIYRMFKSLALDIDKETARCLLIGIISDTGRFLFPKTTEEDFLATADIVKMGVDLYDIVWHISYNESLDNLKLKAIAYTNMKIDYENKFAYTTVTKKELAENNINKSETMKTSDMIKTLENMDFVIGISEDINESGQYNVSFRAHEPDYDVSILAEATNGGGHKAAAGGVLYDLKSMDEAVDKVLEIIHKLKSESRIP